MIIKRNRTQLDVNLDNPTTTVFLLCGQENSKTAEVHSLIETKTWDEWQHWFLITNISLLSNDEIQLWFKGKTSDYYAVLGGKNKPKTIAQQGPVAQLLNNDGQPGYLKIRRAFLKGDEA